MTLNEKQKRFVEEYLVDLNATQAAVRAGYSAKRAGEIGYQLLHKTTVQCAVREAMEKRRERTGFTQDSVLEELAKVAFQAAADSPESDLKYSSKLKALELLGKHLGLFTDRLEVQAPEPLRVEVDYGDG